MNLIHVLRNLPRPGFQSFQALHTLYSILYRYIIYLYYIKSLSHSAEYKNKLTDDFFLRFAWISVFSSGHPHCKTCHSSDGNENNFRSAVQDSSQSQYLHRMVVSRIFPSNWRNTNRFFCVDFQAEFFEKFYGEKSVPVSLYLSAENP